MKIEVECPGKPELHFQIIEGSIRLTDLKRYYPNAVGLTSIRNAKKYCVNVEDEELKIV